jgi:hypothetical protein
MPSALLRAGAAVELAGGFLPALEGGSDKDDDDDEWPLRGAVNAKRVPIPTLPSHC